MNSHALPKLLISASLGLLLSACQSLAPSDEPARYERHAWEHTPAGCHGEECPLVNIDTLHFPAEPALDRLIERRLLELAADGPGAPLPASLASHERDFLASARPGWSSYLQAQVREQADGRILIELSSYRYTGGAHGQPGRGFIDFDRRQHKALDLSDLLLPGQEEAFWAKAEEAHRRWLVAQGFAADEQFTRIWPFRKTPHIALSRSGLLLKYDVYSIAPYSSGHPELLIPYPQLNGILKTEYFPRGKK